MKASLAILFVGASAAAMAQTRSYARSTTHTTGGIVATSQILASQAGAQILARGGSAIDAAIAANAVLGVTEPSMDGIGGDLFVLYWDAKARKLHGLNASGPAPHKMTVEFLRAKGFSKMPDAGIHSVTVPGCVDGWEKLHKRFGRIAWPKLFAAAIHHAEHGFPVHDMMARIWSSPAYLQSGSGAAEVFLPGGRPPAAGEIFRNPGLARAYRLIAEQGAPAFYKGAIAEAIAATSRKLGGSLDAADLASFSSEWVEPISVQYRGATVYELPPNGHGIAALQMLGMMENYPMRGMKHASADGLHVMIEAMKLAYADLRHVADMKFSKVPVPGMLSKPYLQSRAAAIAMDKARCDVAPGQPPASSDTTYLAVVDKEGNIASVIQSISSAWGSAVVVDGMGFPLHNRGASFEFDPAHPNALVPGKRPRHTIIPAFLERGGVKMGFGIMGGLNQPLAHAQFVSNLIDHDMDLQEALEAPRFTKREFGGCNILIESRVPPDVVKELERRGHQVTVTAPYDGYMGRGQAVQHNTKTRVNSGGSSPQGDGAAVPEPLIP